MLRVIVLILLLLVLAALINEEGQVELCAKATLMTWRQCFNDRHPALRVTTPED
jgi:hypothetical protein